MNKQSVALFGYCAKLDTICVLVSDERNYHLITESAGESKDVQLEY